MKFTTIKIKNFTKIFFGVFSLTVCFILIPSALFSGEVDGNNRAANITPLIKNTTCMLAYVNLDQINVDEFFNKNLNDIDKTIKKIGFDPNSEKRIINESLRLLKNIKSEFKIQLDNLKNATKIKDAYFIIQSNQFNKLKSSIKFSITFAIPADKRSAEDRNNLRQWINELGENLNGAAEQHINVNNVNANKINLLSWAFGQYSGFDVVVAEFDCFLPNMNGAEHSAPVVVPAEEEISPADELIDGDELAAREKNWINNFFNVNSKDVAGLIAEAFDKHEKNAPVQIIFTNMKNIKDAIDYVLPKSIDGGENLDDQLKKQIKQLPIIETANKFILKVKDAVNNFAKSKWTSIILNPKSMKFECAIQMENEADAKIFLESLIEMNDVYCDFIIVEPFKDMEKKKSRFQPFLSAVIKRVYRSNVPLRNGDRLELKQQDNEFHKFLCAEYCIVGYILLIVFNR
ncbi:MAG: hypothetical protein LBP59_02365 [Planctomycetaceae bacterium]|jgi:hypothetical protein|nr:hypothetical protein [Planctomycetaceae bacterium]